MSTRAGVDDRVHFGVDRTAELIALPARDTHAVAGAVAQVGAVLAAARRADIAGGDDLVVFDDDRAEVAPQAGAALGDGLGDVEVVVDLIASCHIGSHPL